MAHQSAPSCQSREARKGCISLCGSTVEWFHKVKLKCHIETLQTLNGHLQVRVALKEMGCLSPGPQEFFLLNGYHLPHKGDSLDALGIPSPSLRTA